METEPTPQPTPPASEEDRKLARHTVLFLTLAAITTAVAAGIAASNYIVGLNAGVAVYFFGAFLFEGGLILVKELKK